MQNTAGLPDRKKTFADTSRQQTILSNATNGNGAPAASSIRPRCSFCIFTYNQEKYIREAVEGAFLQDYDGEMEIIISDDCSSDKTFDIAKDMAVAYFGPRKIILNRNAKNLGVAGNVNKCFELASGEWIVMAGGDDVSLPERVSVLMTAVAESPGIRAIGSEFYSIDGLGARHDNKKKLLQLRRKNHRIEAASIHEILRRFDANQFGLLIGAMAAWHQDVFRRFGPIQPNLWVEDVSLSIRARLIGKLSYLHRPLVSYRTHGESITNNGNTQKKDKKKKYGRMAAVFDSIAADLDMCGNAYAPFAKHYRKSAGYLRNYARWDELEKIEKTQTAFFFIKRIFRNWFFRKIYPQIRRLF